jgi:hypothetical protein
VWGSPFGMSVEGYEELHDIHVRLKQEGRGGVRSRFERVQVRAPAPVQEDATGARRASRRRHAGRPRRRSTDRRR